MRFRHLLFLPSVLQLIVSGAFGLGVDEAHYMLYGRYLDWSYFDHPPLVGWIHFLFNSVFGETEFSARLPAILIGLLTTQVLYRLMRRREYGEKVATLATLATMTIFQIFILNLFLLPETLLVFWGALLALVCDRVAMSKILTIRSAVWLGLLLALSALSKYSAILFVPPVAIFLFSTFGVRILLKRELWIAVLIALLGTLPVIGWNRAHDWISFKYQAGHVLSGNDRLKSFGQSLLMQIALVTPWFWLAGVLTFFGMWRDRRYLFVRFCLATFATFFILASFKSTVLPHWAAVFYEFVVLFGAAIWLVRYPKIFRWALGFQIVVLSAATLFFTTGLASRVPDVLREITGWPEIMAKAREISRQKPGSAVAVFNWTYGSRAFFYGGRAGFAKQDMFVIDDRFDQFDLWNPGQPTNRDTLLISFSYDKLNRDNFTCPGGWGGETPLPIYKSDRLIYTTYLTWCLR